MAKGSAETQLSVDAASRAPAVMWFRQDLRLADNPALEAAVASGRPLICVYIWDDTAAGGWPLGGAVRWWLHNSLASLKADLERRGGRLILLRGEQTTVLEQLIAESGADLVVWNRRYEPAGQTSDAATKARLKALGVAAQSYNASLLFEPWELKTGTGGGFKVYSAFARAARARGLAGGSLAAPARIEGLAFSVKGLELVQLGLLPQKPDWAAGLRATWSPGEDGAQLRLERFLANGLAGYSETRNRLDLDATSKLSPHLQWGEISPNRVWRTVEAAVAANPDLAEDGRVFCSELLWREFSHHLLHHAPNMPEHNWKPAFDGFPWGDAGDPLLEAWRRGQTGYPLVDAAMRELWVTGFMHNRARMIAASFLIKHLLGHWRVGEDWFWDTLVDASLATNAASWQWVAGSGADASPFFRIFNPVTQGQKFDPTGAYVRRWLPQLAGLPDQFIHHPWVAPAEILSRANVRLGETYPKPVVDHGAARARALAAFQSLKEAA